MVYITKANSQRMVGELKLSDLHLEGEVYDKPIYFFNELEKQSLLAYKELMEHPEKFVDYVYRRIRPQFNDNYVFDRGSYPCYHLFPDCQRLRSEYHNWLIPQAIKDKGHESVESFRSWIKASFELQELIDNDPEAFQFRVQQKFGVVVQMREMVIPNSGTKEFENRDLTSIVQDIEFQLKMAGIFYYKSKKNTAILHRYSRRSYLWSSPSLLEDNDTGYPDDEVKELLHYYHENFKQPIMQLLREYYRVKFNPELSMEGTLLAQLGFHECPECYAKWAEVDFESA